MKRYLTWIVAAELLFATGHLYANNVEVPGLLTDHTVSSVGHDFYRGIQRQMGKRIYR
ncbi:assembly/transport component in curli production [Salmonella enterica subsp. arizonae]|uniref:Assembly/transport component in curli production n=1 Tax=Salmonella enterica subsp. arizonae TaxID=59203 RepID=A0A2X4TE40_SALER|nr:assembly/transport component in curli production [Salmonella enterica subsp. arizonae]